MKAKSTLFCLVFAFCTNTSITVYAQAVNKQDSLALVDLYNSTYGPNWFDHTGWLASPVGNWYGIGLTDTRTRVESINLYGNNLIGSIPTSLGNLVNLIYMDLEYNQLSGKIPSSLGNLADLSYLYLQNNQLSGAIPPELGKAVNLVSLGLSNNQLSGSIPSSLGNIGSLGNLLLDNNQLSGRIPSSFGNYINFNWLFLNNNQLSGPIPPELGNISFIWGGRLNLSNNQLSGSIPVSFGHFKDIFELNLSNNQLSGRIPSKLGNIRTSRATIDLDLSNNQLSGHIPPSIGDLKLRLLSLNNNQLSGSIPSSFAKLLGIWRLNLSNNQLSGSIPAIGRLRGLGYLNLSNNQLSGRIPSSIGNAAAFYALYLNDNQLTGRIPPSLGNLFYLDTLNLSNNKLKDSIPSFLANLTNLKYLHLESNYFTFNGMELIAQKFPFAIYDSQAVIRLRKNDNGLYVSAGGTLSKNTYNWFMVGQTGKITITGDSVFHPVQKGQYFASITNSVATKLILHSDTIHYAPPDEFVEAASLENALQQNEKANLFLVYPNPAKNILHVQTNGTISFSLLNQSGKILLITNINGEGSINISGIGAGLYYLKNTSTGAVQKVIIAK